MNNESSLPGRRFLLPHELHGGGPGGLPEAVGVDLPGDREGLPGSHFQVETASAEGGKKGSGGR